MKNQKYIVRWSHIYDSYFLYDTDKKLIDYSICDDEFSVMQEIANRLNEDLLTKLGQILKP